MSKIFISYSFKPWGERESVMAVLIPLVKKCVENCKWTVVDPMVEMDPYSSGVKNKVELALLDSDALIAEGTLLMPNVMYECGHIHAQKKPLIYLIDKSAYSNLDYINYFKLIGVSSQNKTASDFGDLEYVEYQGDKLNEKKYQDELTEKLTNIFIAKFQPHLSVGSVMLNRSFNRLNRKLGKVLELNRGLPDKLNEQPFLAFLSGWINQLSYELLENENTFRLDIDYYEKCLSEFTESSRKDIYAIADLTDMAEPFWFMNPEPKHTKVAGRIFLLDIEWCFDRPMIQKYFELLASQAKDYPVFIGLKNHLNSLPSYNHFGFATYGMNCIIVKPNIVGRYVKTSSKKVNKERVMLQFVVDNHETAKHLTDYDYLKKKTIPFDNNQWANFENMVDALFKKYEIGKWKEPWNVAASERDNTYFDWYEGHIRAWIKDYNDLINRCLTAIFRIKATSMMTNKFKILEIGFGSGTLSKPLIEDKQINYFGIDPALRRWEIMLQKKFGQKWQDIKSKFISGRAWDNIPPEIATNAPYDLICGSLVLHDFYEDNEQAKKAFDDMLSYIEQSRLLSSKGAIVFADVFLGKDTPNRDSLIQSWKAYMGNIGKLSPLEIEKFESGNKEMFENLSENEIITISKKYNYVATFSISPERFHKSPFKILILEKM